MKPTNNTHIVTKKTTNGHIEAVCKLRDLGQGPYLSCTYIEYEGKLDVAGGCGTDTMWEELGLTRLARWHLSSLASGPMHYVANAVYWAQVAAGVGLYEQRSYDPDPCKAFNSLVVFGAVDGDEMFTLGASGVPDVGCTLTKEQCDATRARIKHVVTTWCEKRLPALMVAFEADLLHFGLVE